MEWEKVVGCVSRESSEGSVPYIQYAKFLRYFSWCAGVPLSSLINPGLTLSAEQVSTPGVYDMGLRVYVPKQCSRPAHSRRSITANHSWSYTYEVGALAFF